MVVAYCHFCDPLLSFFMTHTLITDNGCSMQDEPISRHASSAVGDPAGDPQRSLQLHFAQVHVVLQLLVAWSVASVAIIALCMELSPHVCSIDLCICVCAI